MPAGSRSTCRDCKREYTRTPEEDYFGDADGSIPESATSERCFASHAHGGRNGPEVTPVQVIDLTVGRGLTPRPLAQAWLGGAA